MDKIRGVIDPEKLINTLRGCLFRDPSYRQDDKNDKNWFFLDSLEDLLIILGPTASGKTKFAVACAELLNGEIISADSRQVYRHMDIGTGKDLAEYGNIPYHLIDIVEPGEKYNIHRFSHDFEAAYRDIVQRGKHPIVCGGTGFYIQSLIAPQPYSQVPVDDVFRKEMEALEKDELQSLLKSSSLPSDFDVDYSSKKRMVRALEIAAWAKNNPTQRLQPMKTYSATLIGLNPDLETRRQRISTRLQERLGAGMIEEVRSLLDMGITHDELEYYGLEYKYISYYLQGTLTYEAFVRKLETEIHRYAKRQMTYFRKMEKDGATIKWIT